MKRDSKKLSDGKGMIPLAPIDLRRIKTFDEMLRAMELTSFGGRRVGEAANVLTKMLKDDSVFKVLTLSGAMTVAQQGLVICDLIEMGFNCVVSTGALMTHGLVHGIGASHFKTLEGTSDEALYEMGANRVYDTIELETNLTGAAEIVQKAFEKAPSDKVWLSREVTATLGRYLSVHTPPNARSIFKTAYKLGVPIYIPAFTDSELGLDLCITRYQQARHRRPILRYDDFLDLEHYTKLVEDAIKQGKKLGIFTIGGGVPRNWAQQVGPHLEIRKARLKLKEGVQARFSYGVRICTATESDGGLSGCTYKEGTSWGKFVPVSDGGQYAEVIADATMVLPLIVKAVMERLSPRKNRGY